MSNEDLIAEAEERLQTAIDAQKRLDGGEYDYGIMADIRTKDVQFHRAVVTALRATEAQLSEKSMEADVGRWVYSRIEALMDATPGTAEAVELSYLASAVGHVEEYGVENCEGHDLGGDTLRAAEEAEEILAAENARWKRRVEIQRDLIIRHEQTIERFLEALMFIKSGDCADPENTARRTIGGEP